MKNNEELLQEYYKKVENAPHRPLLEWAAASNESSIFTAIDCGCGTGEDSVYLSLLGYTVHAFDINSNAVEICSNKFENHPNVLVTENSFENFCYPRSGLVVAHSSLFFCDPSVFTNTLDKILASIQVGGIFCGDFMGVNDSWAEGSRHTITTLPEAQVKSLFDQFEILKFTERDEVGRTALGKPKHWHTYTVVARKCRPT